MAKTWQVVLATIAIFVAGLVTGGATAIGVVKWMARHSRMGGPGMPAYGPRPGQQFGPQLMRSFAKRLDLTDEQRAMIDPIVRRTASQLGHERHEVQLASALAIERMQDQIAEILTPEQRAKFDALIAGQRARLKQLRESGQATPPVPEPPAQSAPGPK